MKTKFSGILALLLVLVVQLSFAQQKTITGTVNDDSGLPLPGANVIIKDTNTGTQTDFDGNYSVSAATGQTLVFSYIGFETQEMAVGASSVINVNLAVGNVLETVVVTGYSNRSRDVLTSAVSLVTSEELQELTSTTSIDNLLQGKAAGVQVTAANGKPGSTAFVRIRGISSLTAGASSPLYIIDGAPIDENDLNAIPNSEIESISILKDAATTAAYGSRGAAGVILITTKRGKKNRDAKVTYSSRYGVTNRTDTGINIMNAEQKLNYENELAQLIVPGTEDNPVYGVPVARNLPGFTSTPEERQFLLDNAVDWEDTVLREGIIQSNSVTISGGEEKTDYFFSVGHDRNTGIIDGVSGFERLNGRLNVNYEAKSWLHAGTSVAYSRATTDEPRDRNNVQNPFRAIYDYNAYEPEFILDDNGNVTNDENGDPLYNFNHTGFLVTEAIATTPEDEVQNITFFNSYAKAIFSDNWSYNIRFSLNHENYRREYYIQPGNRLDFFVGDTETPGFKRDNGFQEVDYTISNTLNYDLNTESGHNLNSYGLFEYNFNEVNSYNINSRGFSTAALTTASNASLIEQTSSTGRSRLALVSYGVFSSYDYKGRYLFSGSARYDGSSNFGDDNQYGLFYSASAGWNIAKESFFDVEQIDNLKLRASYGTVGSRAGIGRYAALTTVNSGAVTGFGGATIPNRIGNPLLQWEETAIFDIGLEVGLFNNRVSAVFDYYRKETDNLLFGIPTPDESGVFSINGNLGKIENSGFEVELSAEIFRSENLNWSIGGNFAVQENKILELPDNDFDGAGDDIETGFNILYREGEAITSFYLTPYAGVDPATGRPTYLNIDDEVVFFDELEGENRRLLDKTTLPKYEGGFFSNAKYKGFGLRTDFTYKFGHYINNFVRSNLLSDGQSIDDNQDVAAFNYWKNPGDTNVLPNPIYGNEVLGGTDRFLEKGDFVRLRNVTLSYNFPKKYLEKTPFETLRVYGQGQNLLTFSDFNGEPEVGVSSGETISQANTVAFGEATLYSYPALKSVQFGVDLSF